MQEITYDLKEDDILYFLHIPKTAGMSLTSILDNYFNYDSILLASGWHDLIPILPLDFSKYRLIRGHFGYSINRILPKKPIFMTMLREPVERTISDYEYMKRYPMSNEQVEFFSKNKNIVDFLKDNSMSWRLTNNQTRYIGIDRDVVDHPYSSVKTGLGMISPKMSTEYKSDDEPSDEKLLGIAKQRLLDFSFFGLSERFYDSMLLFAYTFGFRPNINLSKRNVTNRTRKDDLSEDSIELLHDCTKLDRDLYTYAKGIFDSRFTKMIHDLEEKYMNHKIQDMPFQDRMFEMLQDNYEARFCDTGKSDVIEYDFRQKVQGTGWEAREFTSTGIAFRWTGPEATSSIYFAIRRDGNKKLRFRIIYALTSDILESLRVKVDDEMVELKELLNYGKNHIFEAVIPKADGQEKLFTKVTFQVDHTASPSSINPNSTDERLLGIAMDWIRVL